MTTTTNLEDAVAGAAAAPPKPGTTLTQDLNTPAFLDRLTNSIPATSRLTAERLVTAVLNEIAKSAGTKGDLLKCTRSSIAGATVACAQLGLAPGPLGLVYLSPRNRNIGDRNAPEWISECQLQIGYKGYLALCRRSGDVREVTAWTVYEGDEFEFWRTEAGAHLKHKPAPESTRGEPARWYMHCILNSGAPIIEVLEKSDVDRRRKMSQGNEHASSPWVTNYDAMAKKSCFRSALPWLPIETEVAQRLAFDEMVVEDRAGHLVATVPEGDEGEPDVPEAEQERREAIRAIGDFVAAVSDEERPEMIRLLVEQFGPSRDLDFDGAMKALEWCTKYRPGEAPPPVAAPTYPKDPGTPMTDHHRRRLMAQFGELGIKDRAERLDIINDRLTLLIREGVIGPREPIESSNDLTDMECLAVIARLEAERVGRESGGEPF